MVDILNISEKLFMQMVMDAARTLGWMVYHTHDSRRSEPGFPDLVMVWGKGEQNNRIIFAELKSKKGKLTKEQEAWLKALAQNPGVDVFVWRPHEWDDILLELTRR